MKQKILFTLFLSMVSLGLFAQKEKNYFEEYKQYHHLQMSDSFHVYKFVCEAKSSLTPKRDKEYTWYYNNTIHTTAGNYSGKLLSGEYTQLDKKSNQLKEKGYYKAGLKVEKWYSWNSNGTLSSYTEYKNGYKNGIHITYADSNKYAIKGTYKKNEKRGLWTEYKNGKKAITSQYKHNIKNGKQKTYNEDGNIINVCHYKNGKLNGKSTNYKDGHIESTEYYKNDKQVTPAESESPLKKFIRNKKEARKKSNTTKENNNKKIQKEKESKKAKQNSSVKQKTNDNSKKAKQATSTKQKTKDTSRKEVSKNKKNTVKK